MAGRRRGRAEILLAQRRDDIKRFSRLIMDECATRRSYGLELPSPRALYQRIAARRRRERARVKGDVRPHPDDPLRNAVLVSQSGLDAYHRSKKPKPRKRAFVVDVMNMEGRRKLV